MHTRVMLTVLLASRLIAGNSARPPDEYKVKAAFLYNFAKFVEWPQATFASPVAPLVICVLGEDPFGRELDDVINGKQIDGRGVEARRIADAGKTKGCQILFVGYNERKRMHSIPSALNDVGILTVGESETGSDGMIVNFILEDNRIRFAINPDAAERSKLRLSSRLLNLAVIVKK